MISLQLIRVRSKDGNFRFELQPSSDISELISKVRGDYGKPNGNHSSHNLKILETAPNADPASITISNQPRGNEAQVSTLRGRTLQNLGLQ